MLTTVGVLNDVDGLRHPPIPTRTANHVVTPAGTAEAWIERHGCKVLVVGQELCHDRRHLLGRGMRHRELQSQIRLAELGHGRMHHWRRAGVQGWSAGGVVRVRGLCGLFDGHRCMDAYAGKRLDGSMYSLRHGDTSYSASRRLRLVYKITGMGKGRHLGSKDENSLLTKGVFL